MLLVFSDLDGTLLDHHSYAFDAALPALERLRRLSIPLILASSKTAAEIVPLRAALGFDHCEAIIENGAGLLEAGQTEVSADEATRSYVLDALAQIPGTLRSGFSGFADWSLQQTVARTGLDAGSAAAARRRDFTEPGLWQGDPLDLDDFIRALGEQGVVVTRGGRFLTLSFSANKVDQMRALQARYTVGQVAPLLTVALGDAPNDYAMLSSADRGILIPNPAIDNEPAVPRGLIYAPAPGPEGWCLALMALLDELNNGSLQNHE